MKRILSFLPALFIACLFSAPAHAQWDWARNASAQGNVFGSYSAVDASGNVYITGYINANSATFGAHTVTDSSLYPHVFVVKYDSSGNVLWARNSAGPGSATPNSIATDAAGNVYVTGAFADSYMSFGGVTINNSDNTVGGNTNDIFVVKYTSAGNVSWARSAGGSMGDYGNAVSTDAWGHVFVSGDYISPVAVFGSDTIYNNKNINFGGSNIFVAKYDTAGNVLWAKDYHGYGNSSEHVAGTAVDAAGNLLLGGNYTDTSITLGATTIVNPNVYLQALYLAKLDSAGSPLWLRSASGIGGGMSISSVSVDALGNVYACGGFGSLGIDFGLDSIVRQGVASSGDLFMIKYNASGAPVWDRMVPGHYGSGANSVSADASGHLYLMGSFGQGNIIFGTDTLSDTSSNFLADMFVAKYDTAGNVSWASGISGDYSVNGATVVASGNGAYVYGTSGSTGLQFGTVSLTNGNWFNIFLAKLNVQPLGTATIKGNGGTISLYPDPNRGQMTLKLANADVSTVTIYDMQGKQVYSNVINGRTSQICLPDCAAGVYYLKAVSGNSYETLPFVIVK